MKNLSDDHLREPRPRGIGLDNILDGAHWVSLYPCASYAE